MKQLPEAYEAYLAGKDEDFIATVKPILQQSAAEGDHGVRVVIDPPLLQAHLDSHVPFGTVVEDVD
jgi:hypothetical protein